MCEEKMFQLQFMPHAVKCVDQRFAGKNFGHCVSSLPLILDFSNKKIKILHAKKLVQVCIVFSVLREGSGYCYPNCMMRRKF